MPPHADSAPLCPLPSRSALPMPVRAVKIAFRRTSERTTAAQLIDLRVSGGIADLRVGHSRLHASPEIIINYRSWHDRREGEGRNGERRDGRRADRGWLLDDWTEREILYLIFPVTRRSLAFITTAISACWLSGRNATLPPSLVY